MTDSLSYQDILTIRDPARRMEHRADDRRRTVALVVVGVVSSASLIAMFGGGLGWWSREEVVLWPATVVLVLTAVVSAAFGFRRLPGTIELSGPAGDEVLHAVRRAQAAARSAERSAVTLTGPAGDEASVRAHTLSAAVWQLAEFATQAPYSGPGRAAVAAELERRASALEDVATALEHVRWKSDDLAALANADALVADARVAIHRLQQ